MTNVTLNVLMNQTKVSKILKRPKNSKKQCRTCVLQSFAKLRRAASRDNSDKTNILSTRNSGNENLKPSKQSAGEIDEVKTSDKR